MRKRLALAVMALMLLPMPAAADPATAAFAAGSIADWASTYSLMKTPPYKGDTFEIHPVELNPMINWAQEKPAVMIAVGAGIDVAGLVAWNRLMKDKPKLRKAGLYAAAAVRFGLAYHNYRTAGRMKAGIK